MEEQENNELTIIADDRTEELFKILFIVLGTSDGEHFEYCTEEEQEEAEEMFNTYMDDPKISEARK